MPKLSRHYNVRIMCFSKNKIQKITLHTLLLPLAASTLIKLFRKMLNIPHPKKIFIKNKLWSKILNFQEYSWILVEMKTSKLNKYSRKILQPSQFFPLPYLPSLLAPWKGNSKVHFATLFAHYLLKSLYSLEWIFLPKPSKIVGYL